MYRKRKSFSCGVAATVAALALGTVPAPDSFAAPTPTAGPILAEENPNTTAATLPDESGKFHLREVAQSTLQVLSVDSAEGPQGAAANYDSGPADKALDGDETTFWMSNLGQGTGAVELPHYIIIGTKDGKALPNVAQVTLASLKISSTRPGRPKDFTVDVLSEGDCRASDAPWKRVAEASAPSTFDYDSVVDFDPQPVSCVKVTYLSSWYRASDVDASMATLAEFRMAQHLPGEGDRTDPAATPVLPRNLPAGAISSKTILEPLALDRRRADDADKTPIALALPSQNGTQIVGARPSTTPAVLDTATISGKAYYLDCQAADGGNGSLGKPWNSLDQIWQHGTFQAGDAILLKRGTRCEGTLQFKGSGTENARIIVDAYGDPSAPLPRIDARGRIISDPALLPEHLAKDPEKGLDSAAVRLYNQEYITVRNLELTNFSGNLEDYTKRRRGLAVILNDFGTGHGYDISDLYVHDVLGRPEKDLGGSGGIQFESHGIADGNPTRFENVEIHHNRVRHINRSGINNGSSYRKRRSVGAAVMSGPALPHLAWGPMQVHDNIVSDIGGDGIVTQFASGSQVYNNTVWDTSNHLGGRSLSSNNAAMWVWNADNVQYRNNHVFETKMPRGTWDGTAFDADYGTAGTLFEGNVSHDNDGGFLLFCGCGGMSSAAVARYNLSLNDGSAKYPQLEDSKLISMLGETDGQLYNNTFLLYPNVRLDAKWADRTNVTFSNNVFLAQGDVRTVRKETSEVVVPWINNIYGGTEKTWPSPQRNTVLPDLKPNSGTGLDVVRIGADVVGGKGLSAGYEQLQDLVGTKVPLYARPDMGAFQLTTPQPDKAVANGGFEHGDQGWTLSDGAAVDTAARSGEQALSLPTAGAKAEQTITVGTNRTYRLMAAVKAGADGTLPQVTFKNPAGVTATATGDVDLGDGWVGVSALMRTSWDASTLTVGVTGQGLVDDISVAVVRDYMVDGSFQAMNVTRGRPDLTGWTATASARATTGVSGESSLALGEGEKSSNSETYVDEVGVSYTVAGWGASDGSIIVAASDFSKTAANTRSRAATGESQVAITSTSWAQGQFDFVPEKLQFTVSCGLAEGTAGLCDDVMLVRSWDGTVAAVDVVPPQPSPEPSPAPEPSAAPTASAPATPQPAAGDSARPTGQTSSSVSVVIRPGLPKTGK